MATLSDIFIGKVTQQFVAMVLDILSLNLTL